MKVREKLKGVSKSAKAGMKAGVKKKSFRLGTYTAAATIAVLAILVIINMCVSAIPSRYTEIDLSSGNLYSVGNQTENAVKSLEQPVKIYWIVQEGQEDVTIEKLLSNYEDLSSMIKVEKVDPVVNPNFAYQYTGSSVYDNSIIVTNEDETRTRYISYYDIYEYSYDEYYNEETSFDGEGEVTSAINFVTSQVQSKVYYLTGHGEASIPDNMVTALQKSNMSLNSLSLLTEAEIPGDCKALIIYSPQKDLSRQDADKVKNYLENGGKLLLITDCSGESFDNLYAVMSEYGIEAVDGMVVENNSNYYISSYANYLVPYIESHEITDTLISGNYYIIMPMAQGLKISETSDYETDDDDGSEDEYLTVTPLLTTSDSAFSKKAGVNSITAEKEEGDIDSEEGFVLAAAASKITDNGEAGVVWIGTSYLLDEQIDNMAAGANLEFVTDSVGWLTGEEETAAISAKTMSFEYLSLTSAQASRLTFIMVVIIPVAFLAAGIIIWMRRRKL